MRRMLSETFRHLNVDAHRVRAGVRVCVCARVCVCVCVCAHTHVCVCAYTHDHAWHTFGRGDTRTRGRTPLSDRSTSSARFTRTALPITPHLLPARFCRHTSFLFECFCWKLVFFFCKVPDGEHIALLEIYVCSFE
jgi:hypothetical protein